MTHLGCTATVSRWVVAPAPQGADPGAVRTRAHAQWTGLPLTCAGSTEAPSTSPIFLPTRGRQVSLSFLSFSFEKEAGVLEEEQG